MKLVFKLLFILVGMLSSDIVCAKRASYKAYRTTKTYSPKAAYSGFGKKSSATGKIKTKTAHGHFKKSLGYKFVNPYSRS